MEIFRITRNAWGQETLGGLSWDLLPWFVGVAAAFIVLHALFMLLRRPRERASARE
jgi:hypothetical protein